MNSLRMDILRDDGAVVYLNGVEVIRENLPPGDIGFDTPAVVSVGGSDEGTFFGRMLDPALLIEGENLLAVEIHQSSRMSSDLGFDLSLIAERFGSQPPNTPPDFFVLQPIDGEIFQAGEDIFFMAETFDEDGYTEKVEYFANDLKIGEVFLDTDPPPGPGLPIAVEFFWIDPPPGVYQVRLEATDNMGGIGVSDPINLTIQEQESPQRELHVVGIYSGTTESGGASKNHEQGKAAVVIDRPGKIVTLVLSAYEPVHWLLEVEEGTEIERVFSGGYYEQEISGLGSEVEIVALREDGFHPDCSWIGFDVDSGRFYESLPCLYALTEMEISSFHGRYQAPFPAPFTIDSVQNDPRLSMDYPVPVSSGQLPDLSWTLQFGNPPGGNVFSRDYSLAGPETGTDLFPGTRLISDSNGLSYFGLKGHAVWRINSHTGGAYLMNPGGEIPEMSWPMGLTWDHKRDRLLLVSLGGKGHLCAYSEGEGHWWLVADMRDRDFDSLVYHGWNDSLYGVSVVPPGGGNPRLFQLSPQGGYLGEMELPLLPFGTGPGEYHSELVSIGRYLALLWGPETPDTLPCDRRTSRIYLIDPETQDVWLTYRDRHPATEVVITWPDPDDIMYGTPLNFQQLNAQANVPGAFTYHPLAGAILDAGEHVLSVTFRPYDVGCALMKRQTAELKVRPAPLTIRAEDKARFAGEPNPELTASYQGLVAGDTPADLQVLVTLVTAAGLESPPGVYPIQAYGAEDPNYAILHQDGTLTVRSSGGQAGALDPDFDPSRSGVWRASTPNQFVIRSIELQKDNKILVGGSFILDADREYRNLVRLLPDGGLDEDFDPGIGPNGEVFVIQLDEDDDSILIGGAFTAVDGRQRDRLARILSDGRLHEDFRPFVTGEACAAVTALGLQEDRKIIVGGECITHINGVFRDLARLWPNSLLDFAFHSIDLNWVSDIEIQDDGNILLSGMLKPEGPEPLRAVVRIGPDGFPDAGFAIPVIQEFDHTGRVWSLQLDREGRILVGGCFFKVNEVERNGLARLYSNGKLDLGFNPVSAQFGTLGGVKDLDVQPDGRILTGSPGGGVARFNSDGSLDTSLEVEVNGVEAVTLQPDGRILIGGSFERVNGQLMPGLARIQGAGSPPVPQAFATRHLPEAFQPGTWFLVTLEVHPAPGMSTYAIEDIPPPGWEADDISHNGVYDVHTGKVKFGPFNDTEPRELHYEVHPPLDAENIDCFIGSASADGLLFPIEGDDCIRGVPPLHPADLHPPESVITIEEVTGYGSAWRRGEDWPNPPNPIPMNYVTRAAALWKGGEYYELDLSEGEPPMCWVNRPAPGSLRLGLSGISEPMIREMAAIAYRHLPDAYVPGLPIMLQVEVMPGIQTGAYAVEIGCPADAEARDISDGGNWDKGAGMIRWGPFMDAQPRSLTCRVTPSRLAGQPISFPGAFSVDGMFAPLEGPLVVQPGACIKGITWNAQEGMIIDIGGVQGATYIIEVSSDLMQWATLGDVTAIDGEGRLIDEQAGQFHHRFYRIRDVAGE